MAKLNSARPDQADRYGNAVSLLPHFSRIYHLLYELFELTERTLETIRRQREQVAGPFERRMLNHVPVIRPPR